jgi:myosin-crossreactive antigen
MTATITSYNEDLPKLIKKICKRDVHTAFDPTGGMLSIKDSN